MPAATGYVVEAGSAPGVANLAVLNNAANSFSTGGVPAGTYYVRVRAVNAEGVGPASTDVVVSVLGCVGPPAAPSGLSASAVGFNVTLAWQSSGDGCASGYRLVAGSAPGLSNIATVDLPTPSLHVPGVPPGVYYLRVFAFNASGLSAPSNDVALSVGCLSAPNAPLNLSGTVNGSLVSLAWAPPSVGCAPTDYLLLASLSPGAPPIAVLPVTLPSLMVNAPNGTFFVRVVARNAIGQSASSNEVTVVVGSAPPPPPPPPPPSGNLEVVQSTVLLTSDTFGDAMVIGEVANNSTQVVTFPEVAATFRSAGGTVVGTDSTFVTGRSRRLSASGLITDTSLAPGEHGCFLMFTNVPGTLVANVQLALSFDTFGVSNLAGNIVINGAPTRSSSLGNLRLDGTVANVGSRLSYFTQAAFLIKNNAGRAIECTTTYVDGVNVPLPSGVTSTSGVMPGTTAPYTEFTLAPFSQAGPITAWTLWEEFSSGLDVATSSNLPTPDEMATPSTPRERAEQRDAREREKRRRVITR